MNLFEWLENWYLCNCDGDWEHSYGIKINTLDNPGWLIDIDLINTPYESKSFETVQIHRNDYDWVHCSINNCVFQGNGGPNNLEEIIKIFYEWVTLVKN